MRIRVLSTESFRLAALFAVLFTAFASVLIATVYWIVDDVQTTTLLSAVDLDITTIRNAYSVQGVPEAVEVVQQRLGPIGGDNQDTSGGYILLQSKDGQRLAGNLPRLSPTPGLMSFRTPESGGIIRHAKSGMRDLGESRNAVLGRGILLGSDIYLFVGRDTTAIATTRTRILRAFAWLTGGTFILAAVGGLLFSVQFLRRIDAITRTCNSIMTGRFDDRIALRGSNDELDRLARVINSMLDRISTLLDNLRQVSSDVAHDLRTPLTHLRQRLEEARVSATGVAEYSSAVTRAIDDTDEILSIFTALLRISQIESGSRLRSFEKFSLGDLLTKVHETFSPVAEDHGKRLRLSIQSDPSVRGDTELLLQMFSNLIENAIRHTPSDTEIVLGLAQSGQTAIASVSDNGPGIAVEEREKVLRRFYRVAASRSTPGNGLGLALVAAIASLHHSRVELLDNHPGLRINIAFAMAD